MRSALLANLAARPDGHYRAMLGPVEAAPPVVAPASLEPAAEAPPRAEVEEESATPAGVVEAMLAADESGAPPDSADAAPLFSEWVACNIVHVLPHLGATFWQSVDRAFAPGDGGGAEGGGGGAVWRSPALYKRMMKNSNATKENPGDREWCKDLAVPASFCDDRRVDTYAHVAYRKAAE